MRERYREMPELQANHCENMNFLAWSSKDMLPAPTNELYITFLMCAPKSHYEGLIQLYQQTVLRRNLLIPIILSSLEFHEFRVESSIVGAMKPLDRSLALSWSVPLRRNNGKIVRNVF